MKLSQLHHLVAIVEHGSLRAAARHLDVPQPVLTRSIGVLEKELGGALFTRETKGMALTPIGRRFHTRASAIVHESQRAREEVAQQLGDERGTVVAAMSIMPHVGMFAHALPLFRQRYPRVCLQVFEGLFPDVEHKLRNGSLDFYLGAAPRTNPMPGLHTQVLFDNTRAVIARKGHPLSRAGSLKALASADWAITSVDYDAELDLNQLFASNGLKPPSILLHARSALSMMVALANSDLLAMLPIQWDEFPLTKDALDVVPICEVLPAPAIVLVRRSDLPLTPAAGYLVDMLLRQIPLNLKKETT
jgi:LysR family transcriptional regulator, regulator of abg operon